MVVDRTGRGISGILLILATTILGLSVSQISILALLIIGLWIFLIFRIRREYVNTFRTSLAKRSLDPDELRIRLEDSSHVDLLLPALEGHNIPQTVFALSLLS
jgi:AAA family ATP:ADP antiporter